MSDSIESLIWHSVNEEMPDADLTVLVWMKDIDDDACEWAAAWWDGECWREAESGDTFKHCAVTHWTEPNGPR